MKLKNIFIALAAVLAAASCAKQEEILVRDVDAFSVDGNKNIVTHYVKASGAWHIESSADWLSFDPSEGVGDGVNFQPVKITVAYNHGQERQAVFTIVSGSKTADVAVSQGLSDFRLGTPAVTGSLKVGEESAAVVTIPYTGASGEEEFSYHFTLSGEADGLGIPDGKLTAKEGNDSFGIAIVGTPQKEGEVTITGTFGTLNVGPLKIKITKPVVPGGPGDGQLTGIPCGWNFYALGMAAAEVQNSEAYGKNWFGKTDADAYVPATSGGNIDAKLQNVFVNGTCTNRTFNPSVQVQGMLENDYWLISIPVSGLAAGTPLAIEVGCGGAGGSVGFYIMEYSTDNSTWTEVPGAILQTRGTDSFYAHLWNTPSSIGASGYTNTRKTYDKTTDDTYHKYTLEAPAVASGTLYFRLRVLKYRATPESTSAVGAGWTDLKGFEVSVSK